jgi:hypothetical protein
MRETRQERGGQIAAWWVARSSLRSCSTIRVETLQPRAREVFASSRYLVHVRTATGAGGHAGRSPRRPGSYPGTVSVGFVVDRVELEQIFLRVLALSVILAVESDVN